MATPIPTLQRSSFDTGPLSWVIGEIRDALARAATALREAAGRSPEAQPTLLLHAKTHLHQAHGALQLVDVEGVGVYTGAAEAVLDGFKNGELPCTVDSVQVVLDAFGALGEYLDELLAGMPQQPARLFPYYRDMVERQGERKVHPSDLMPLDLSVLPGLPAPEGDDQVDIAACRGRFEKALLPYLKAEDDAGRKNPAADLVAAIAPIAATQAEGRARLFWQAMHACATVVADGQVESDLYIKQLFGQVNLQLRRLVKGETDAPEAMLRDALFFIAAAREPGPEARALRQALGLDGAVPPDYAERRYGKLDPQALQEAREALARTKSDWDRIAGEGKPDAQVESDFNDALARLAGASEKLGAPALAQLLRELGRAASDSVQSGRDDQFGLEMAAAMLFVENGLDQLRQLPDDFSENAEAVGARLLALAAGETPPDAPHWQGELARQIQQGQTVAVLANEVKAGLRQIEKLLDDYYDDPSKRQVLGQAAPILHQLQGAFAILDQDQAVLAVRHVEEAVRALAASEADVTDQHASLHNIAQNIGALGFFADLLAQDSEAARGRFTFDLDKLLLRELPFEFVEAPAEAEPVAEPAKEIAYGVDAELLGIFIAEAQEVLAFVVETLPRAADEPSNQEILTQLRRAFHTLKGSSRMVDLEAFAATAAAIERVMNVWLADGRSATADLLALLAHAYAELDAWVAELAAGRTPDRDGAALIEAAGRVQEGGPFEPLTEEPLVLDDIIEAPALDDIPLLDEPLEMQGDDGVKRVGDLAIPQALHDVYLGETETLCATLEQGFDALRRGLDKQVVQDAVMAAHTLSGTSATVGYGALRDLAHELETTLEKLAAPGTKLEDSQFELFDATLSRMRTMLQVFTLGELAPGQPDLVEQLATLRERLASQQAAALYGEADPALASQLDALFAAAYEQLLAAPPAFEARQAPEAAPKTAVTDDIDDLFDSFLDDTFAAPELDQAAPQGQEAAPDAARAADFVAVTPDEAVLAEAVPEAEPELESEPEPELVGASYADEIDPDLLPVFLEEAADLLPRIGHDLRQWHSAPTNTTIAQGMQRDLHTVKGSARMAGAMRLGQHAHELETQIENMVHAGTSTLPATAFDELLANYDAAMLLFEALQQPAQAEAAPEQAQAHTPAPAEPVRSPLVRVRADILDRVVNQAGEVSITRSRLENQMGALKGSLGDFSDNVARLRRQLREIEMQAESQIASKLSISGEREFDPLEFDRFTRLQELTRMLAESVDDVASFQESLARTVDGANEELASQARMTRDLQRDLMRVRMVPFASLSERLFRVARQTAKETDKRVNLDIRGGAVEIDRGVLEQMAAPFEHLLRNAIVHGIEPRAARQGAGKAETGELLVQVSQHGNEVMIVFGDDGAGLDLERIRAKAQANGLLADGEDASDQDVTDLIFEPGFSTADTLTELAGRGVGMDVVRSEAQALGGRVAVTSEPGQGAQFTITLPLTLAVAQVVLVTAGGRTHAVPSTLVERVEQVRALDLAAAIEAGHISLAGATLALHALPGLLGEDEDEDEDERTANQRSTPVLVLNGGASRIALRVDEVLGNREVVVKHIGPQLSRVPGIAGATVLGSGEIVLILDPLALAQQPQAAAQVKTEVARQVRRPTVMVVDDSLTVRRVTQRLLEREGYRVQLAKDGVEALELIAQGAPDLMLVDIEMPRMDGYDLTRNVRGNEATRDIPIIMITSRTADKHRNVALGLGVNAYYGKPYQESVLLAAIEGLLNRDGA
ncbi:Hpt domain-containing protein [Massilia sp. CFBP9012]|uniref:hybrid sensor histidine kinase/response regulator n=1 Tax=Massilia sp. CFBP9012 TaxID=3096531 RepID=UPI002A6ABB62|nr:Hpt domain-containing protein [Massilia sp. CFBP9012]MDY0974305.1 Hpt domain-containing protein [Massilia sp. CFBP9012]